MSGKDPKIQMTSFCCSSLAAGIDREEKTNRDSTKTDKENVPSSSTSTLEYGIDDIPAPHLSFLFGLQQILLSISSTMSMPLVMTIHICASDLPLARSNIMSTFLFMCGVATILQCIVGVRLPILQGGCSKFLPAIAALMALEKWKCPDMTPYTAKNSTLDAAEIWQPRMRELQGGIMVASVFQILLGCTGLLGLTLQFIGPITIVPTISLVGLSLIDIAFKFCNAHWGISSLTVALLFLFSLYLRDVRVPVPRCSRKNGFHVSHYPVFKLLPVFLAVLISWALCAILTLFDVAPDSIKTDAKSEALDTADWFYFPYPGQWGLPTVSAAGVIAMLSATIASIVESVGDYYACARVCEVPPPPAHAMNRGIAIEGFSSLICGAVGSGGATTSYSQNIGAIGYTRVASRAVFIVAGGIFLVAGLVGKVGAFLTTMPDPVLGGIVLVSFGMVTSVGLSALSFIDLNSPRNLTIIGTSLMVGLMIPRHLENKNIVLDTGVPDLDSALNVLLGTSMFIGGFLAFFLDNTVPGTKEERGMLKWRAQVDKYTGKDDMANDEEHGTHYSHHATPEEKKSHGTEATDIPNGNGEAQAYSETTAKTNDSEHRSEYFDRSCKVYDLPFITPYLRKMACARYWPFLPTFAYGDYQFRCCKCCRD